jgi:hypothetical protein
MARARNIKPGFFRNADLVELSFEARLLFIGIWTLADRAGRLEDRPKQIKMELFPADNMDCDGCIQSLANIGMVKRYEVDGKRYLQVTNFAKHQSPHRDEKASTLPDYNESSANYNKEPDLHGASTVQALCDKDANTGSIALIADCLIADCLETKPSAAALAELPVAEQPANAAAGFADAVLFRAIEITALLTKRGAALQASDPRVRGWAERGVTDTQALQALDVANERRQERADHRPINAGLLDSILGDITKFSTNARASPVRMSHADQSKLAASRAIFGTEVEGKTNDQNYRIIDVTPAAAAALGC